MLELHPSARECANSAILISGSARSGTTIVGKLIHSFSSAEYVFEPPALIALFPLMDAMPRQQWDYLYEAYIYEEFLINAVAGRAINTNRMDDSSIFAAKDEEEIAGRLGRIWTKGETTRLAVSRRAAYKIPSIVAWIPELRRRYPGMAVVMMVRNAVETIHSLMAKHTFTPNHSSAALGWPSRRDGGAVIPYWVKRGDEALWKELNEIDRCAYYYICMSEGADAAERQCLLKYSELLATPLTVAERLADFLGVGFGERTCSVIETIRPTGKPLDRGIIDSISEQFRVRVVEYSARAE
jgi:hypothetical protein